MRLPAEANPRRCPQVFSCNTGKSRLARVQRRQRGDDAHVEPTFHGTRLPRCVQRKEASTAEAARVLGPLSLLKR